jgi:hypothetical protein
MAPAPGDCPEGGRQVASLRKGLTMQDRALAFVAIAAAACFVTASAQAGGVQPTKGQSAEQTQRDVAECQTLAVQASGFDPAAAAGAVVGASKQRQDRRATRAAEQQQAAETGSKAAAYDQANRSCLLGRGYTITP